MVTEQYAAGALDGSVDPEELTTLLAQENQALLATVAQLKAENAELRRDAERYRWIASNVSDDAVGRGSEWHRDWRRAWRLPLLLSNSAVAEQFTFEETIDQAMIKEQQP